MDTGGTSREVAGRDIGWLITYSGFLGPVAGIFIADYWVVRRARLSLADLYTERGQYGRWNTKALVGLTLGVIAALVGLLVPPLRVLYDYAWFVGFGVAFVTYVVLMRGTPVVDLSGVPGAVGGRLGEAAPPGTLNQHPEP